MTKKLLAAVTIGVLVGCGGGGSNSLASLDGGSTGSVPNPYAGTYAGTFSENGAAYVPSATVTIDTAGNTVATTTVSGTETHHVTGTLSFFGVFAGRDGIIGLSGRAGRPGIHIDIGFNSPDSNLTIKADK